MTEGLDDLCAKYKIPVLPDFPLSRHGLASVTGDLSKLCDIDPLWRALRSVVKDVTCTEETPWKHVVITEDKGDSWTSHFHYENSSLCMAAKYQAHVIDPGDGTRDYIIIQELWFPIPAFPPGRRTTHVWGLHKKPDRIFSDFVVIDYDVREAEPTLAFVIESFIDMILRRVAKEEAPENRVEVKPWQRSPNAKAYGGAADGVLSALSDPLDEWIQPERFAEELMVMLQIPHIMSPEETNLVRQIEVVQDSETAWRRRTTFNGRLFNEALGLKDEVIRALGGDPEVDPWRELRYKYDKESGTFVGEEWDIVQGKTRTDVTKILQNPLRVEAWQIYPQKRRAGAGVAKLHYANVNEMLRRAGVV